MTSCSASPGPCGPDVSPLHARPHAAPSRAKRAVSTRVIFSIPPAEARIEGQRSRSSGPISPGAGRAYRLLACTWPRRDVRPGSIVRLPGHAGLLADQGSRPPSGTAAVRAEQVVQPPGPIGAGSVPRGRASACVASCTQSATHCTGLADGWTRSPTPSSKMSGRRPDDRRQPGCPQGYGRGWRLVFKPAVPAAGVGGTAADLLQTAHEQDSPGQEKISSAIAGARTMRIRAVPARAGADG